MRVERCHPTIEEKELYTVVNADSKVLLEVDANGYRGTNSAASLYRLNAKHDIGNTDILANVGGHLTTLSWHGLSGQSDYSDWNHVRT